MSDLLDKHSPDYDPDAYAALVDDQRKREKESGRGEHLAEALAVERHQEAKHARRRALDPETWPCDHPRCGHRHKPGSRCGHNGCECRA